MTFVYIPIISSLVIDAHLRLSSAFYFGVFAAVVSRQLSSRFNITQCVLFFYFYIRTL